MRRPGDVAVYLSRAGVWGYSTQCYFRKVWEEAKVLISTKSQSVTAMIHYSTATDCSKPQAEQPDVTNENSNHSVWLKPATFGTLDPVSQRFETQALRPQQQLCGTSPP